MAPCSLLMNADDHQSNKQKKEEQQEEIAAGRNLLQSTDRCPRARAPRDP